MLHGMVTLWAFAFGAAFAWCNVLESKYPLVIKHMENIGKSTISDDFPTHTGDFQYA